MPIDTRDERLERRIADLKASDPQFAAASPDDAVSAAIEQPDLRLAHLVATVFDGYADRPALGARAVEFTTDADTGRTTAELLPRFQTVSYRELSERVQSITNALAVRPGPSRRPRRAAGLHQCRLHIRRHRADRPWRGLRAAADKRARRATAPDRLRDGTVRHRLERRLSQRRSRTGPHRLRAGAPDRVRLPGAGR